MNHLLCGLAANEKLPTALVDRLIAIADAEVAAHLAVRADLSRAQAVALAARVEESAVHLAYEGRLTAADIDPRARPDAALALLDQGMGRPGWARLFAADPVVEHREKLAACPGLPPDVVEALIADTDMRVVAEVALWAAPDVAARLAEHPHAEVRRTPPARTPPAPYMSRLPPTRSRPMRAGGDGGPHRPPAVSASRAAVRISSEIGEPLVPRARTSAPTMVQSRAIPSSSSAASHSAKSPTPSA